MIYFFEFTSGVTFGLEFIEAPIIYENDEEEDVAFSNMVVLHLGIFKFGIGLGK